MSNGQESKMFAGQVGLVTGAGSGIERAVAQALAERGMRVVCADINAAAAEETARNLDGALAITMDVRDQDSCEAAVEATITRFGRLDGLVTAAGVQVREKMRADEFDRDEFARIIDVNLIGTYLSARAAAREMIAQGSSGRMVLIGSIGGQTTPMFGIAPYTASKGGVTMLGRSLAYDWAQHDIRVNVLAPGVVRTAMTAASFADPEKYRSFLDHIPMGRVAEVGEMASVAVFLLSDAAAYMTGAFVPVDGGWLA